MNLINNPWVIGIVGGILSGLVVTLITRYILSRRDNREYTQKVITANQEIIYAIRPGILEGIIPSDEVIDSLITETAKKYSIESRDLYDTIAFADVLIKDVMDSSFLSISLKSDYCNKLTLLKQKTRQKEITTEAPSLSTRNVSEINEYRRKMLSMISVMLGVTAALMTSTMSLFIIPKTIDIFMLLFPPLIILFAMFFTIFILRIKKFSERKHKDNSLEKYESIENSDILKKDKFLKIKNLMPELLAEIKHDLMQDKSKLIREFMILPNNRVIYGSVKKRFVYYEDEHSNLRNKIDFLEQYSLVIEVTTDNIPVYRMLEEFIEFVKREDLEI